MAEKTVIDVRNVCKTYFMDGGTSQSVLKDINFQIKSGEFVAIMGPSGSGKSTLMNILGCLDKPTSGKYILEGYDIAAKDDNELAAIRGKTIGFVFQNFNLMMKRTIADNVSLPLIYQKVGEDERYKRALEMLDKVNLAGYQDRPPSQISGGMQQRVQISKALANNPSILLLDEVTTGLDLSVQAKVLDLIRRIKAKYGISILLVSHDLAVIRMLADRTVVMLDGKIIESGLTDQILEDPQHAYTQQLVHSLL